MPVDVTTTIHDGAADRTETRTEQGGWSLKCHADADADDTWWGFPPDFTWAWPGGTAITGEWADEEHTTITFDCQDTWQPRNYGPNSGETGATSFSLHGEVELQLP